MFSLPSILITLATIVSLAESTPSDSNNFTSRIVGGDEAGEGQFPYFVEMSGSGCGGALISPDTVLFAAHCEDNQGMQVIIGSWRPNVGSYRGDASKEPVIRHCDEWIPHPDFGSGGHHLNYDVALCKLNHPTYIDESFVTLKLNDEGDFPKKNDDLIVMGQGVLAQAGGAPDILHNVTVPTLTNEDCNKREMYYGEITNAMFCAGFTDGGKDSCQGDSGGPIVKRVYEEGKFTDYHVGVVSWGIGCAKRNKPGVYARTSSVYDWIKDTTCNAFNSRAEWCNNNVEEPECEAEVDIILNSDTYPRETSWSMTDENGKEIAYRKFSMENFVNDDWLCLKKGKCYDFGIVDDYGDGLCDDEICKTYRVSAPGKAPFYESGDFGFGESFNFCVSNEGHDIIQASMLATPRPTTKRPTSKPTTKRPTSKPTTKRPTRRPTSARRLRH